jgi:hypothetical protein
MDSEQKIMLPRLGGSLRTTVYQIRCGCWRCRVPVLRKRHWLKLTRELDRG